LEHHNIQNTRKHNWKICEWKSGRTITPLKHPHHSL